MRRLSILLPVLALLGCGQASADGYTFGKEEFAQTEIAVQFVVHDNVRELQRAFPNNRPNGPELMAWSRVSPSAKTCEVHIVDPRRRYQPEWIGHEIAHCMFGRWHPQAH